jgi:hypothetical protein
LEHCAQAIELGTRPGETCGPDSLHHRSGASLIAAISAKGAGRRHLVVSVLHTDSLAILTRKPHIHREYYSCGNKMLQGGFIGKA